MQQINFVLKGIDDITHEEGKLSFIALELTRACDLKCLYCFESAGRADKDELTLEEKMRVLKEAAELGAKSLIIPGSGEPTIDRDFRAVVELAHSLGMTSCIYTDGTFIDREMAIFMHEHDVTPLVKLESMPPEIQDFLTGKLGSHAGSLRALDNLIAVGYVPKGNVTRLATATLYTTKNIDDLPVIAQWATERGIKPTFDTLSLTGRAKEHAYLLPTLEQIQEAQKNLPGESLTHPDKPCVLWKYGVIIDNTGNAKFCTAVKSDIGNIRTGYSVKDLFERKDLLYPARAGTITCPVKEPDYVHGRPTGGLIQIKKVV